MLVYLKMLKFALPPMLTLTFVLPPMQTTNTNRWIIGRVESQTQNSPAGRVDFMLFVLISTQFAVEYGLNHLTILRPVGDIFLIHSPLNLEFLCNMQDHGILLTNKQLTQAKCSQSSVRHTICQSQYFVRRLISLQMSGCRLPPETLCPASQPYDIKPVFSGSFTQEVPGIQALSGEY